MHDLSHKIGITLQPVFVSRKLEQDLKPREIKPSIVNQQCVVYSFTCDLCVSDYVGYYNILTPLFFFNLTITKYI